MTDRLHTLKWREWAQAIEKQNLAEATDTCAEALGIYGELLEVLLEYLSGLQSVSPKKLKLVEPQLTKRLELCSVVIQALPTLELSLFNASYATLAALLKQETDAVTRLHEYKVGRAKNGRTPNTGNHGTPAQKYFLRALQPLAHLSHSEVSEYLSWHVENERLQLKIMPVFDEQAFNQLCDVHCHNLAVFIIRLEEVFIDAYEMKLTEQQLERLKGPAEELKIRIENRH